MNNKKHRDNSMHFHLFPLFILARLSVVPRLPLVRGFIFQRFFFIQKCVLYSWSFFNSGAFYGERQTFFVFTFMLFIVHIYAFYCSQRVFIFRRGLLMFSEVFFWFTDCFFYCSQRSFLVQRSCGCGRYRPRYIGRLASHIQGR